jgi:hypothetical protein
MATTAFAQALTRLNGSVVSRLADTVALVDSYRVNGIFDRQADEFGGMVATAPSFIVATDDVPRVAQGSTVRIPVGSAVLRYQVRELLPDGGGMTRLVLESTQ